MAALRPVERLRFVARLLEGEKMASLCREFDISRKTGYKIFQRYRDCGVHGLTDRSRRPYRHANQLPVQVETVIVRLRREHPSWGAPKIREKLRRLHGERQLPAISTVHAVLDRHGLVSRLLDADTRCRAPVYPSPASPTTYGAPTTRASSCSPIGATATPLTITDFASRYLLSCEALSTTKEAYAFAVFERAFHDFGLPRAIRTDNGVPFARRMPCSA